MTLAAEITFYTDNHPFLRIGAALAKREDVDALIAALAQISGEKPSIEHFADTEL
jgi:hypothetical protein